MRRIDVKDAATVVRYAFLFGALLGVLGDEIVRSVIS